MQSFDIIKQSSAQESFRVKAIMGNYDLQTSHTEEHFTGFLDIDYDWNIGLIVGRSGSGKTTIARELFGDNIINRYEYSHTSILDDMPKGVSVSEIEKALTAVGFASPPSWLKPYAVLSNGEKMRCDLARAILEKRELFCFDEFTSVVDRNVAQVASFAMQKAIRRGGKKFVAVSCHYDIQEWLMPDWVFNTDTMTFTRLDLDEQKKNRPRIELDIVETQRKQQYWEIFRKYHYLNGSLNPISRAFVAFANGELCAFVAVLPFPHPIKKDTYRIHRIVVLPDYQGIGIARGLLDYLGEYYDNAGKALIIQTSNIGMAMMLASNPRWRVGRVGRVGRGSAGGAVHNYNNKANTISNARITISAEYKRKIVQYGKKKGI